MQNVTQVVVTSNDMMSSPAKTAYMTIISTLQKYLKCMFMLFNILLYSQINISIWTNFIFTDHLSIWLVNYRSFYSRLSNLL